MILAWMIACGGGPTVATTPRRTVPLASPWDGWDLPVGEGRVVASGPETLAIDYEGDQVDSLSAPWRTAVRAAGFVEDLDTSAPELTNVRYVDGAVALNLSVVAAGDRTTVIATLVDAPPAD